MSNQESLFGAEELPETEHEANWKEMPEYSHKDMQPKYQIIVSFETVDDLMDFGKLVNQKLTRKTQSIWYPEVTVDKVIGRKQFANGEPTREEMARAAGEAAGEIGNAYFEKTVSEEMFPDDPEKAKEFAEDLENSRDELREMQEPQSCLCDMCDNPIYPGEEQSGDFNSTICESCFAEQAGE